VTVTTSESGTVLLATGTSPAFWTTILVASAPPVTFTPALTAKRP
jgi:hypothetical protein